jgi:hypothetical protein
MPTNARREPTEQLVAAEAVGEKEPRLGHPNVEVGHLVRQHIYRLGLKPKR